MNILGAIDVFNSVIVEGNELRVVSECKTVGYHRGDGEEVSGFHGVFLVFPSARTFDK